MHDTPFEDFQAQQMQDWDRREPGVRTFERPIAVPRYQAGEVAETALGKQKEPM